MQARLIHVVDVAPALLSLDSPNFVAARQAHARRDATSGHLHLRDRRPRDIANVLQAGDVLSFVVLLGRARLRALGLLHEHHLRKRVAGKVGAGRGQRHDVFLAVIERVQHDDLVDQIGRVCDGHIEDALQAGPREPLTQVLGLIDAALEVDAVDLDLAHCPGH